MKKLIISLFMFLLLPITAFAYVDYDITDYYIESYIKENGDLEVYEMIVLDGTFNGYERDIIYQNPNLSDNTSSFSNNSIYNGGIIYSEQIFAKYVDEVSFDTLNDKDWNLLSISHNAENGDNDKYVKSYITGGNRYRMYYPANGEKVAFAIHYIISDAVVMHNDLAELYWTFIGEDFADDLNNVNIKVFLPQSDNSEDFRIWAHGDLTGEVEFLVENENKVGLFAKIDEVDAYESVDIRTTFNKNLITNDKSLDHTNVDALEKILEVENARANEANLLREQAKRQYYTIIGITITYLLALLIAFIYVVKKFGLDSKHDFKHEYNRDFIDDYNVEVVDYLLNKENISPDAMSASIMNLVYKKNIKVEEIPSEKKKKEYKFTLLNQDNTNDSENKLIAFLFNKIGSVDNNGTKTFTTEQLKKYASSRKSCESFVNSYTNWKKSVINEGKAQGFYEKTTAAKIIGGIFFLLALVLYTVVYTMDYELAGLELAPFVVLFIIAFALINALRKKTSKVAYIIFWILMIVFGPEFLDYFVNYNEDYSLIYIALILSISFFIYTLFNTKKTNKGSLHQAKWKAFKRFLEDFGNFSEKELPEITLWERYLVYATVLGIADKVQKAMNVKIEEIGMYTNNPTYVNINVSRDINRAITNSVNSSYREQAAKRAAESARDISSSSFSSGSGGGGGFSSGGGFGGGGGGGRGF